MYSFYGVMYLSSVSIHNFIVTMKFSQLVISIISIAGGTTSSVAHASASHGDGVKEIARYLRVKRSVDLRRPDRVMHRAMSLKMARSGCIQSAMGNQSKKPSMQQSQEM